MNESIIALIVVAGALLVVLMLIALIGKPRLDKKYFAKQWETIEHDTNTFSAVVRADSLLDEALKNAGVKGSTMGERLNNGAGFIRDVNSAWAAHKLRNRVVHEPATQLSHVDAHKALKQFKKSLQDMGAL